VKAKTVEELAPDGVVNAYEIEGTLKKRDGKWRFVTARYTQGL
jgi:hypothetical protein